MKTTRMQILLAVASLALCAQVAQAAPIVFDFGGSVSLTCSSSSGACAVSQVDSRLLNLDSASGSDSISSLIKSMNNALRDIDSISFRAGSTYIDLGRRIDAAALINSLNDDSGVVNSLLWRPGGALLGRFEWRRVKTPMRSVPEPGTYAMLGVALVGLFWMWRRRKNLATDQGAV